MTTSTSYPTEDFQHAPSGREYGTVERASSEFTEVELNKDLKVSINRRNFNHQYSNVYYTRLELLRESITRKASEEWDGMKINDIVAKRCNKVLDVRQGKLVWLVGTVYNEMKLKPNILDEVTAKVYGPKTEIPKQYIGDDDEVMLEDESGRMELCGDKIKSELLVTGTVVAVLGTEDSAGSFQVLDIKMPGFPPQEPRSVDNNNRKYVAIASGLDLGSSDEDPIKLELLQGFLLGELGGEEDVELVRKISSLILLGNSLADQDQEQLSTKNKYSRFNSTYNAEPLARLDRMIDELCSTMNVSILPGDTDPTTQTMPQQPIHKHLFTNSKKYVGSARLNNVTNPYMFSIDGGTKLLATGGQTIDDIYKYARDDYKNRLTLMEYTLKWRHMAPTCPDTLWSYPFHDTDPFVLRECPHIYAVGNQQQFQTSVVNDGETSVRLVTIPKFIETGEIVLVDISTGECKVVKVC